MSIKMTGTNPDPNGGAFQRADRDPALTRAVEDGPPLGQSVADDGLEPSGSTTLGNIRKNYAEDGVDEIDVTFDNSAAVDPGKSPNSWVGNTTPDGIFRGADPYRQEGLSGPSPDRDYLENQGE
jgi:hypothetical protein